MAQTHKIQLIVDAENRAKGAMSSVNKSLDSVRGKLERMQPAFQKMALAGTVAFGALALGAKTAVDQAAKAEGSYNKFNAVFGEHRDDMLEFVKEIRKEMPTATSDIVRMAADMQDLLVPMGMARDEATEVSKGFLDLANKVAAFNDVNPTEVLEAIKSGLAGSSEPLRRYGINALETALEARAMKMGLIELGGSFKDLDPEVKNSVRAQALLAQAVENSSDAIEGFEDNADSFIRRQQEMAARITETKEKIGNLLLPILDKLLKKLLPIIEKMSEWISEHPKLTLYIGLAALALAGLVATLGFLGIILPGVITAVVAIGGAIGAITLPIIGVIAMLTALGIAIGYIALKWNMHVDNMKWAFEIFKETIGMVIEWIKDKFGAFVSWIDGKVQAVINSVKKAISAVANIPGVGAVTGAVKAVGGAASTALGFITGRQHGGPVAAGESYLIGERGPEIFTPGQYGQITAGGGANITINITDNEFVGEEGVAERIGSRIMRSIKDTVKL